MATMFGPLLDACALLRLVHPDMTVAQAQVLLEIMQDVGIEQGRLSERAGIKDSSVSRVLGILSTGSRRTGGLGIIEINIDPNDRRFKVFTLTAKGIQLKDTLNKLLNAYSYNHKREE